MKRLILFLVLFLMNRGIAFAENNTADAQAALVYKQCAAKVPETTERDPIQGNIEDVKRERLIRSCLKEKVIKITSKSLPESEFIIFQKALSEMEEISFNVYKALIFCQGDENWCQERYQDDMSLEKLMLEKELTAQMKNILTSALEHQ